MKIEKILVIGAGRFGSALTKRLFELGVKVVVVDKDERRVEEVRRWASEALVLDASDKEAIDELKEYNFDAACIALSENFSASLLILVYLKNIGIPYIVGRASDAVQAEILQKIGCNLVVLPEEIIGIDLAERLVLGDVKRFKLSEKFIIAELPAAPYYWGKLLGNIDFSSKNLILCALKKTFKTKKGFDYTFVPPYIADTIVEEGDAFIILGNQKNIANFSLGK